MSLEIGNLNEKTGRAGGGFAVRIMRPRKLAYTYDRGGQTKRVSEWKPDLSLQMLLGIAWLQLRVMLQKLKVALANTSVAPVGF